MPLPISTIPVVLNSQSFGTWLNAANLSYENVNTVVNWGQDIEVQIGTLASLTTTAKNSLVAAINEVDAQAGNVGNLGSLTTTDKSSVVSSINEVDARSKTVGTLASLTTTNKSSIVGAVNEVDARSKTVGTLASLTTTDKTFIVNAINEVDTRSKTVGSLASLTTSDKTLVVNAINELQSEILTNDASIATIFVTLGNQPVGIHIGTGVPVNGLGIDGQKYIRTTTLQIYTKASGTWSITDDLIISATETTVGSAEIATQTEVNAGTDDIRIVTPLKAASRFSVLGHTHPISDVVSLQTTLDLKTPWTSSTGATQVASGSTAQRPSPVLGQFRFNNTTGKFEGYTPLGWGNVGGGGGLFLGDNGSVGDATDGPKDLFRVNNTTLNANVTITTGKNASVTGPFIIADTFTLTIDTDATLVII